jgi:uncharacterized protein YajQ (UPF0234 family)
LTARRPDNALNQAAKEIQQRYDFKGTDADISWSGESIVIKANSEERAKAALDVFQTKAHQARHLAKVARFLRAPTLGQGVPHHLDHEKRHRSRKCQEDLKDHSR